MRFISSILYISSLSFWAFSWASCASLNYLSFSYWIFCLSSLSFLSYYSFNSFKCLSFSICWSLSSSCFFIFSWYSNSFCSVYCLRFLSLSRVLWRLYISFIFNSNSSYFLFSSNSYWFLNYYSAIWFISSYSFRCFASSASFYKTINSSWIFWFSLEFKLFLS